MRQGIEKLATKVMGWHRVIVNPHWAEAPEYWVDYDGRNFGLCEGWNPFESWNDAGMVWNELAKWGKYLVVSGPHITGEYKAELYPQEDDACDYEHCLGGKGDTGPAAIAEAALKVCT